MVNRKSSMAAALLLASALCAGAAHAGNVQWSVGINLPAVATVVAYEPGHHPAQPVYHVPTPVYVEPAPRVVYRPVPVFVPSHHEPAIRSVWVAPQVAGHVQHEFHHCHHQYRQHRHHRHEARHDRHDEYGDRHRGGQWNEQPRGHRH